MKEPEEWETDSLESAAVKTGLPVNEIIRLGAKGLLRLWLRYPNILTMTGHYEGWAQIPPDTLKPLVNDIKYRDKAADRLIGLTKTPFLRARLNAQGNLICRTTHFSKFITPDGKILEFAEYKKDRRPLDNEPDSLPLPETPLPPPKIVPKSCWLDVNSLRIWPDELKLFSNSGSTTTLKGKRKEKSCNILDAPSKEEKTNLHIIAALLDVAMSKERFNSETALREYISKKYIGFQGCTMKTLATRFKDAKERIYGEDQ